MRTSPYKALCKVLLTALMVAGCSAERDAVGSVAQQPQAPSPPSLQISPILPHESTTLAQKGERVAVLLGCFGCHGKKLQGKVGKGKLEFAVLNPSNLTLALLQYTDAQLERAIREGVRHDGSPLWEMPSEAFLPLSAPDMQALIGYLRSVPPNGNEHPRMVLSPEGQKKVNAGMLTPASESVMKTRHISPIFAGEQHAWGRYLAHTVCGECHGPDLRGNPSSEIFPPDLIVAASYPLTDFRILLKTGQPTGNRKLKLMAKVAKNRFSHLTEAEVDAIHAYLVARTATPH